MKKEEKLFLLLWIINLLGSIGYYLVCSFYILPHRTENSKASETAGTYRLRAFLMILCPVMGPLYFGMGFLLKKTLWFDKLELSAVAFRKEKARTFITADINREQNLAPIEETLQVGDKRGLRELVLNVLRGNLEHSLGSIAMALNSTDSETSHYAASVLRDELNDFRMRVQQFREKFPEEPETETDLETMLFDYMSPILEQKVFSELEQKKYVQILEQTGEQLYRKDPSKMTPDRYDALCAQLRDSGMQTLVEKWTAQLSEQYPEELVAYKNQLKLYFMEKDKPHFFEVLNRLKESDITVDQETLEIIRIFR